MRLQKDGGFTLLELLVALAVSGALLAFVFQICLAQQRTYLIREQLADAQQCARLIVDELTRHLSSLGAGTELEQGQVRLLVAHPHELVFNADLRSDRSTMAPGTAVPGAVGTDPHPTFPAGAYGATSGAETYRFTLDRNGDNRVDAADRTQGEHYTLYREVNGGDLQEVANLVANPRVGEPLFRYWGDFDGDGIVEVLDRVDRTTSPRVAAGAALDAVVRRIEVNLITETSDPDLRYPRTGGYRQVRLVTAVSPENLATAGKYPQFHHLIRQGTPIFGSWAWVVGAVPFRVAPPSEPSHSGPALGELPRSGSVATDRSLPACWHGS